MNLSRRSLLAAGAGLAAGATAVRAGRAMAATAADLVVDTHQIEVYGQPATRYRVARPDGTEGLTLDEGDAFFVRLTNGLKVPTGVHWHGMTEPWRQDGVPYVSAPPIESGASREYLFPAVPAGTRWMHSHFGLQEQNLLAAPLIVRERSAIDSGDQEVVVLLEDFAWEEPEEIFARLRTARPMGAGAVSGPDLNDVEYPAFLANRRTLDDPEVVDVEAGARLRLRIINAAASTNFWIDLGALEGTLVSTDGNPCAPMQVSRVPLAVAQRADVLVTVPAGASAPVLALAEGRDLRAGVILRPSGATVAAVPVESGTEAPAVTLEQEADLRAASPLPARVADRIVPVKLTGQMMGYIWNMPVHDLVGMPAQCAAGERVEIVFDNATLMAHPMHLHGHVFQVVGIDGRRFEGAIRDTVLVPPRTKVTVAFDADNPGLWAFHCHNLYHLAAGMFSTLVYRGFS